ncbi:hypothetical protein LX36DRAFT_685829 [Colletotrichum falcatum]|nr:hypothetical protein LX36DRAFT_685829 [Colletotrichum falcatum]
MSQPGSPLPPAAETAAPIGGAECPLVSGEQTVSQPAAEEVSIGHHQASSAAHGQAEQATLSAPDLGPQKNAMVKTVRIAAQGWPSGGSFDDAEHLWDHLEDEVSAMYRRCYMYPNVETIHVTIAGLEDMYLPAGMPAAFDIVYRTDTDTVYIAAAEDKPETQQQQQQAAAVGNGGKRDLVVRVDVDPGRQRAELDWMPVLSKEAVESEDAYLDSPEFYHRLVWEMTQATVDETLWKVSPRSAAVMVGDIAIVKGPGGE